MRKFTLQTLRKALFLAFSTVATLFFLGSTVAAQDPVFKVVTQYPGCGGSFTHVFVDVTTNGNEVAGAGFTINFEPSKLTNPILTLGSDAQAAGFTSLGASNTNFSQVVDGRVGVILDSGGGLPTTSGDKRVLVIRFDVVPGAAPGPSNVYFSSGNPTLTSASDPLGDPIPFSGLGGNVMIGGAACTTSSDVTVSGRVMTAGGSGLRGAQVMITDSKGNRSTVTTSSLGYYQLENIKSGETYIVGVSSRRYRFSSRTLQVTDNLSDIDFVGLE